MPTKSFKFSALAILLMFCFALASWPARAAFGQLQPTDPPQKMPPLIFEDADHQQHALSDYRGSYVLLNIWASWCGPCVQEMPSLQKLAMSFANPKLIVLPVSEDRGDAATVSAFYSTHKLTHLPVAIDHAGIAPSVLHLRGLPTSILIDPQGREIARIEGDADWSAPETVNLLHKLTSK